MKNTFTLIKEGRTKRISQLKHDLFSCGDKAYTLTLDALKRKEYQILEDVELLYFKNFNFNDTIRFSCQNKETILMLENCSFSKATNFHGGSVVISSPEFSRAFPTVDFFGNKEVELYLDDEKLGSDTPLYNLNGDIDSLFVTGNMKDSFLSRRGRINNLQIKNLSVLSQHRLNNLEWLNAQNIKIEDSIITTWDMKPYCKNLEIKNSRLERCFLHLENSKVKLDNAKFSQIKLPNGMLFETTDELCFSAYNSESTGNKKLAKLGFLSALKAVEQKAIIGCEEKKETITTEVEERYEGYQEACQQRLDYNLERKDFYVRKVMECQSVLNRIEEEKVKIAENVEKSLKKQKVKTMIASTTMKK